MWSWAEAMSRNSKSCLRAAGKETTPMLSWGDFVFGRRNKHRVGFMTARTPKPMFCGIQQGRMQKNTKARKSESSTRKEELDLRFIRRESGISSFLRRFHDDHRIR